MERIWRHRKSGRRADLPTSVGNVGQRRRLSTALVAANRGLSIPDKRMLGGHTFNLLCCSADYSRTS